MRRTLATCCLLLALPAAAHATAPGRNGSIFFQQADSGARETERTSVRALNPRTRRVRILEDWSAHGGALGVSGPDRWVGPPGVSQDGSEVAFSSLERIGSAETAREPYLNLVGAQGTDFRKLRSGRPLIYAPAWLPASDALVGRGEHRPGWQLRAVPLHS